MQQTCGTEHPMAIIQEALLLITSLKPAMKSILTMVEERLGGRAGAEGK